MSIEPLGDAAALITCETEAAAAGLAEAIRAQKPTWLVDLVLVYSSVAAHFDLTQVGFADVQASLSLFAPRKAAVSRSETRQWLHLIPCCYSQGPDLGEVAETLKLSPDELIRLHAAQPYRVFAIGFSPGFPYLGYLPERLQGLARLPSPRKRVEAGSVAIVGKQCCVYPSATPGGWRLIGRTPRLLVDLDEEYFPLRPGDFVQFIPISEAAYAKQRGERLDPPVPLDPKK